MQSVALTSAQMEDLQQRLNALPNGRRPSGLRHRQGTVLSTAIAAVLAGRRSYTAIAEWAADLTQAQLKRLRARFNPRTRRFEPPSEPTLRRVLQTCDVSAVDASFSHWLLGVTHADDAVAIDGKARRGPIRANRTQVHLLSAFLQGQGIPVAQREIPAKTNEIPERKPLLEPLDLAGRVVTAAALHTQCETARFLVEDKQAHSLLTVKANQPALYAHLSALTAAHFPPSAPRPSIRATGAWSNPACWPPPPLTIMSTSPMSPRSVASNAKSPSSNSASNATRPSSS